MKKLFLSLTIAAGIALAGCGDNDGLRLYGNSSPASSPSWTEPAPEPTTEPRQLYTFTAAGMAVYPDGRPIEGVTVSVSPSVSAVTGADGVFSLTFTAYLEDALSLDFSKAGYVFEAMPLTLSAAELIMDAGSIVGFVPITSDTTDFRVLTYPLPDQDFGYYLASSHDLKFIYFAEKEAHLVKRLDTSTGEIIIIAGTVEGDNSGVSGDQAKLAWPQGLALSADDETLYVTCYKSHTIKRITGVKTAATSADVMVTTIAGMSSVGGAFADNTAGNAAKFNCPEDLAVSPDGKTLYVTDLNNHCIRRIKDVDTAADSSATFVDTIAGSRATITSPGTGATAGIPKPRNLTVSSSGDAIYYLNDLGSYVGKVSGLLTADSAADVDVFIIAGSNFWGDVPTTGSVTGDAAKFHSEWGGLALSLDEDTLFVVDHNNNKIKKITGVKTATVSTATTVTLFAGTGTAGNTDGSALSATFRLPRDLVMLGNGSMFYVLDGTSGYNTLLRRITAE